MLRRAFLGLVALAFLSTPAWAQVKLQFKQKEGTEAKHETTTEVTQKLVIAGMDTDTTTNNRILSTTSVGKRDGAGMLKATEKIDHFQANMTVQGMDYSFDSTMPDKAGNSVLDTALRGVHKAISAQTTTTTYDKENQLVSVQKSPDNFAGLPAEAQQLLGNQSDPAALKKAIQQSIDRFPKNPIAKGDKWRNSERHDLGSGQIMTFDNEYTYEGTIQQDNRTLDKITSKVLAVDFAFENSPLPLTLKGSKLKATESEVQILFDREAGEIVSDSSYVRIEGNLDFTINNMDLPSKLDLKLKTTHKVIK